MRIAGRVRNNALASATLTSAVLLTATLAGCRSGEDGDAGDGTETPDSSESIDSETFPTTVETTYGEVTIPAEPERVVALTAQAAGDLLALGITPVAVQSDTPDFFDWYPWLEGEIEEVTLSRDLFADSAANAEAIAALDPDLIVAANWQVPDQAAFERLSQIAPTVGSVGDASNTDWDTFLLHIGSAVGRQAEAEQLVDDVTSELQGIGDQVPDISSKTYQWVRVDEGAFTFGNGAVLEMFGLVPADNQDNTQDGAPLSAENTDQLDADLLLVWAPSPERRAEIDESELFQNLPSVQADTVVYADVAFANALNSADPLSLRWLKDQLTASVKSLATAS